MKNSKNKRTTILVAILVVLLFVAYKVIFMPSVPTDTADQNVAGSQAAEVLLRQVESIKFDTNVIKDPEFTSLKSIEITLPSLPIGRKNPFSKI